MADFPAWLLDITDEDVALSTSRCCMINRRRKAGESAFPVRATEKAVTAAKRAKIAIAKGIEGEGVFSPAEAYSCLRRG